MKKYLLNFYVKIAIVQKTCDSFHIFCESSVKIAIVELKSKHRSVMRIHGKV